MSTPGTSGNQVQFITPNDGGPASTTEQLKTTRRRRLNTPYTKTPCTRNLRRTRTAALSKQAEQPSVDEDVLDEVAQELVGKPWRMYRVSPLYKFDYEKMKKYQRLLAAHVQAEVKKGYGIEVKNEEFADAARMSSLDGLAVQAHDPKAVRILLGQRTAKGALCKAKLTAILCSVGAADHLALGRDEERHFTQLPLMLVRGPLGLTHHLSHWMQMTFDCVVSSLTLSAGSLSWMLAMWCGSVPEHGSKKRVELLYSVPSIVKELSHITLSIDFKQCHRLWKAIHVEEEEEFTERQVEDFIRSLQHHFYHHFKINLETMQLSRIGTAIAYIGSEGKIKIFSGGEIHQVLGHLTEYVLQLKLL